MVAVGALVLDVEVRGKSRERIRAWFTGIHRHEQLETLAHVPQVGRSLEADTLRREAFRCHLGQGVDLQGLNGCPQLVQVERRKGAEECLGRMVLVIGPQ